MLNKDPSEFNKKGNGLQPWCRECNRARSRKYYSENKDKHKKVTLARNNRIRLEVKNEYCKYLLAHPCVDCGEKDIIVLEPDHLRDKKFNVSTMIGAGYSWSRVLEELEKCEVVCKNCHARRTHGRFENGSFKTKFMRERVRSG